MSSDLGHPATETSHGTHAVVHEAEAFPSLAVYAITGIATFVITAIEVWIINFHGYKSLLMPLAAINVGIAALFYQGLWYEHTMYKVITGVGMLLGVITLTGLVVMLPLGMSVQP